MRNAGGYSLQYNGRNIQITTLDCVADYKMLAPQLVYSENYVYYITKERVFVYQGKVIASGDFTYISEEYDGLTLDEWIIKQKVKKAEIALFAEEKFYDMRNRRKYTYEASQSSASEEEEEEEKYSTEEETPEWFIESIEKIKSMEFKTADTGETVMEISVPTVDELDNYFSSIGLEIPGGNF